MQHLAIDLGSRESQICTRDPDGTITSERRIGTVGLPLFLKGQRRSRVVVETCSQAFWVADLAKDLGHEVRVVPATLVKQIGVGARGTKTDKRDARVLSEVSCRIDLPSVHIKSRNARELLSMCKARDVLIACRTMTINNLRGWLRAQNIVLRRGYSSKFTGRVRDKLLSLPDGMPVFVERLLQTIESLSEDIDDATKEILARVRQSPTCQLLMTVPGVGPLTAARFECQVDDVTRFKGAHAIQSYFGLTPGEKSSSERQQRTGITKAGSPAMRWLLIQASWTAWRTRPEDPMVRWARGVADRRGRRVAITGLARKLVGVLYAIWRDGTAYDGGRMLRDRGLMHGE